MIIVVARSDLKEQRRSKKRCSLPSWVRIAKGSLPYTTTFRTRASARSLCGTTSKRNIFCRCSRASFKFPQDRNQMLWLPSFTGLDSIHSKLSLFVLSSYVVLGARTSHLTVATPPLNHSSQTETMAMHHASSYPSDETSACSLPPTRPRRATRRREDVSSTIIAACILSIIAFPDVALGFAPVCNVALRRNENIYQPPTFPTEQRQRSHSNIFQQGQRDGAFKTSQHMSSIAVARMGSPGKRRSSFKDRMRNIVVKDKLRSAEAKVGGKNGRPSNVKVVHTLEDYKTAVGDENEKLVVVRFYATWCKVGAME